MSGSILIKKPYYFLSDRETHYTYFIHNNNKSIYYPDVFELSTQKKIEKTKKKIIRQYVWWSLFNKEKIDPLDFKIGCSKAIDVTAGLVFCLLGARVFTRFLKKLEMPFLEVFMQNRLFDLGNLQYAISYLMFGSIAYFYSNKIIYQSYLYDIALQYKWNFNKDIISSNCEEELQRLSKNRFMIK